MISVMKIARKLMDDGHEVANLRYFYILFLSSRFWLNGFAILLDLEVELPGLVLVEMVLLGWCCSRKPRRVQKYSPHEESSYVTNEERSLLLDQNRATPNRKKLMKIRGRKIVCFYSISQTPQKRNHTECSRTTTSKQLINN